MPQRSHATTRTPQRQGEFSHLLLVVLALLFPLPAGAYLDLAAARLQHLDNGLTLIVLEDHSLPVVSVQMLYRVGARNSWAMWCGRQGRKKQLLQPGKWLCISSAMGMRAG